MRRTYLLISIVSFFVDAQPVGAQTTSGLTIHVTDSSRKAPLVGARITVISGRDTMSVPTDAQGIANHRQIFRADTVELRVSHLGYETKVVRMRSPGTGSIRGVWVALAESPQDIAEIIVVGKAVAVVIRGDTVQFNADAFKTFANDPMSSLFTILPGMTVKDGKLYYLDEQISRVTVDGQRLFNDHIGLALENIRADDVVDVRVYKEASDRDKLDSIANPRLNTVVDVRTKSKPAMIRTTNLSLGAGGAVDSPPGHLPDDRKSFYEASGNLVYTRVGETVSANANGGNLGTSIQSRKAGGAFIYSREAVNKFRVSSNTEANYSDHSQENWEHRAYFPTEDYTSRNYHQENFNREVKKNLSSRNNFDYTFPNRDVFGTRWNISLADNGSRTTNRQLVTLEGVSTQNQQIHRKLDQTPFSLSTSNGFSKRLNSGGRLNVSADASMSKNDGDSWRIDTLSSSTSQIYLEDTRLGRSHQYGGGLTLSQNLSPVFYLSVSDNLSYIHSLSRRMAVDMLTGTVDPANSYDYLIRELRNLLRGEITYRNNSAQHGISQARIDLSWQRRNMQRDEEFPGKDLIARNFNLFSGIASLEYEFSAYNKLNLEYRRTTTHDFSPLSYMKLDDSNPMLLQAGNPDLRASADNDITLKGNFIYGAATYGFDMKLSFVRNRIADKIRYFSEDTYLPAYDYTARAGSMLNTKVNVDGTRSFQLRGDYSVHSGALHSNIRLAAFYANQRIPSFVNGEYTVVAAERYLASLQWIGNFSSTFVPSLSSTSVYHQRYNDMVRNEWFSQVLTLDVRALLLKSVELSAANQLNWDVNWPNIPGMDRFGVVSNVAGAYLFDERGNLRLSASVDDLLNRRQQIRVSVADEHIRSRYSYNIGRYFMFRLQYKF